MADNDKEEFERYIRLIQAETANIFRHVEVDAPVRAMYDNSISQFAAQYRLEASLGKISWKEAATEANKVRNIVMDQMRDQSTSVGKAIAEKKKLNGTSFETMIGRKTAKSMNISTKFDELSHAEKQSVLSRFKEMNSAERNGIYKSIVKSAGKSDPLVTTTMRVAKPAMRTLIFLSVAMSVYTVANADDKLDAFGEESAINLSGIAGGMAGGAAAGLICGPAAPVCVTAGAFIGGAAAAFAVDFYW